MDIKGTGDLSLAKEINLSLVNLPNIKFDFNKLIDPTAKGLNKIFDTIWGEKHANKIRHILLTEAQTKADIELINAGVATYDPEEKTVTKNTEAIKNLLVSAIQDEEIINLLQCSRQAAKYLEEISDDVEISQDFINRWRNEAKLISSDELQSIFGGILASEMNHPGNISLRTLDIVKNLSKEEAEHFLLASKSILWGKFIYDTPDRHIIYAQLNDTGLLRKNSVINYGSGTTGWPQKYFNINNENKECTYIETSQDIFVLDGNASINISSKGIHLSKAGQELYRAMQLDEQPYSDQDYQHTLALIKQEITTKRTGSNTLDSLNYIKIYHSKVKEINFVKVDSIQF